MMPKIKTRMLPALLLALSLMPLLTACGNERPAISLPPAERAAPVGYPVIPAGEALCDGKLCLSDRQTGALLGDSWNAIDACNAKLFWFGDWLAAMTK